MKSLKKKPIKNKKISIIEEKIILSDDPIKPDNQLILSFEELEEVHDNALYFKEPPSNKQSRVIFNNKKKTFIAQKDTTNFKLIDLKSTILNYNSTDASIQFENELCKIPEDLGDDDKESRTETLEEQIQEQSELENEGIDENIEVAEIDEEGNEEFWFAENEMDELNEMTEHSYELKKLLDSFKPEKDPSVLKEESEHTILSLPVKQLCKVIKLQNKFNFFDRYTETKTNYFIEGSTNTLTVDKYSLNINFSLSEMHRIYNEDYLRQQIQLENEKKAKKFSYMNKKTISNMNDVAQNQEELALLKVTKNFEKIESLDETDDIAKDFRYYEDPSDEFRGKEEGSLMLLWTMVYKKVNHLFVTDISWSPDYFDLFAVTLGIPQGHLPFDEHPELGYLCLWSPKNSFYPEYITPTHCSATCVSFHHNYGYLLAVGLCDGTLAVYNVSLSNCEPQYITSADKTNHRSCVKQVVWRDDLPTGELNFFSVAHDGLICQWILMKSEMVKIVRMTLVVDICPEIELRGIKQTYFAKGTAITFNPNDPEIYLVGTVEGFIFKCNAEYCCHVQRFQAHEKTVIRIDYNKYNPNIYLTCSDDHMVKLWEDKAEVPLLVFDMKTGLSDVCWSPFSSTMFCISTTSDCRIVFYDLDISKHKPVCNQLVLPANKYELVRIAFNKRVPMIAIGSSNSTVITFKLSPNLRTTMKPTKKGVPVTSEELELEKLLKVLQNAKV